jgi:hypothetical protein
MFDGLDEAIAEELGEGGTDRLRCHHLFGGLPVRRTYRLWDADRIIIDGPFVGNDLESFAKTEIFPCTASKIEQGSDFFLVTEWVICYNE